MCQQTAVRQSMRGRRYSNRHLSFFLLLNALFSPTPPSLPSPFPLALLLPHAEKHVAARRNDRRAAHGHLLTVGRAG